MEISNNLVYDEKNQLCKEVVQELYEKGELDDSLIKGILKNVRAIVKSRTQISEIRDEAFSEASETIYNILDSPRKKGVMLKIDERVREELGKVFPKEKSELLKEFDNKVYSEEKLKKLLNDLKFNENEIQQILNYAKNPIKNILGYIAVTTYNIVKKHMYKSKREELLFTTYDDIDTKTLADKKLTAEQELIKKGEINEIIKAMIQRLTKREFLIFEYYYIEDKDYDEIAFALDTSYDTVKVQMSRINKKLEELLQNRQFDEISKSYTMH